MEATKKSQDVTRGVLEIVEKYRDDPTLAHRIARHLDREYRVRLSQHYLAVIGSSLGLVGKAS